MPSIRPAAVAGQFYPSEPAALRAWIDQSLAEASADVGTFARQPCPKLLVVPHAGYVYSGAVAAHAYALLAPWRERITRVVLLGPVHRVPVRGLAAPTVSAFETPLGPVSIDRAALADLRTLPQLMFDDSVHALEHSIEVQLPFLQGVLADFTLVPLAVGDATPDEVAEVLEALWGGDETLVVISSDLSHYLSHAQARARDRTTVERVLAFASDIDPHEACGAMPLNGALQVAQRHGLVPRLLDMRNSGDTAGDRQRVVGYGAIAFDPAPAAAHEDNSVLGAALLAAARNAIECRLGLSTQPGAMHPTLARIGATFVTLRDSTGQLRGCKGRIDAQRRLADDVRANAEAAAFEDWRFEPIVHDEWPGLNVEVSLLGPLRPLPCSSEAQALAALRPGIDGVVLRWRGQQAVVLPQVWWDLPEPRDFLAALKHKAGLARDFWAPGVRMQRFSVHRFAEHQP